MPENKDSLDSLLADLHKAFDDLKTGIASSSAPGGDVDFLRPPSPPTPDAPEPPESGKYEFEIKLSAPETRTPVTAETPETPLPGGVCTGGPGAVSASGVAEQVHAPATPTAPPLVPGTFPAARMPSGSLLGDDGEIDFAAPPPEPSAGTTAGDTPPEIFPNARRAAVPPIGGGTSYDIPVTITEPPAAAPPVSSPDRGSAERFEHVLKPEAVLKPDGVPPGAAAVPPAPAEADIGSGGLAVPRAVVAPTADADAGSPVPPIVSGAVSPTIPPSVPPTVETGSSTGVVKVFILYPHDHPEKKELFCEQLAGTLTRISKKPVSLHIVGEQQLADPERDIVRVQDAVLDQIRKNEVSALFLLADGVVHVDDFIRKVSPYVFIAKAINTSELKMKSLYLDIAIDVLLVVK